MLLDRKLGLGTDAAHLLIFDPTLLDHASGWPIGWYADPAVWQHESAADHIAGWCTRSDGGYAVRLTTGDLTAEERAPAGFGLSARWGRR